MIDFEQDDDEASGGAPAWMATFADLMSLLMCFFVLLLSFSEMDVAKYKQIAGSMQSAFGVQNKVKARDIPKGTSIIAKEFSSGRPQPTAMNEVKQSTVDSSKQTLDHRSRPPGTSESKSKSKLSAQETEELLAKKLEALIAETSQDANELKKQMQDEVNANLIDIESGGRSITIRIREKGSFPSASATLNQEFVPVMMKLREVLSDIEGNIAVEGHTDDVPIKYGKFNSNWALSSARAVTVTHELLKKNVLDDRRFMIVGHSDTRPFVENSSRENRARNRRVEIIIRQGLNDEATADIESIQRSNPEIIDTMNLGGKVGAG